MCAGAADWERLNVVHELVTAADVAPRNVTSEHTTTQ